MVWCFHCTLLPLFILSYFTVDGLCKILYFFSLVLKLFLGDLVLIKDPLISNSYERVWLERGDRNEKHDKHEWHAISLKKDALWYSNLNNHVNYTILVPQHFTNSILVRKFIFLYLLVLGWARRERDRRIPVIER